jgi:pimeloyl-ACP methyl ester carboxylesterase
LVTDFEVTDKNRAEGDMSELAQPTLDRTVTSADGTSIAFTRSGDGPTLILVDGAFCHRAMGPSSPLARRLAQHFKVFTYDRRGRAESSDNPPYTVERELEDLDTLIGEAGGSAYVWGISSGAALALEAARRGAGIAKLALYEPPFIVDDSRAPIAADIASQLNDLIVADRRDDAVRLFLRQMGAPRIVIALMRRLPVWRKLRYVAHTLPYDMTIVAPYQRGAALPTDRWESVAVATLVMVGGKSPPWLQHGAQALADALPNASHCVVEGQTHNVKAKSLVVPLGEFFSHSPPAPQERR